MLKRLGWSFVLLTVGCLIAVRSGIDLAGRYAAISASLALAFSFAAVAQAKGRPWHTFFFLLAGAALSIAVALGHLQSIPLLLAPVIVLLTLAWTFGRTLVGTRTPLIERMALIVHDVDALDPPLARYTRNATVAWTTLFIILALGNGWLLFNATPGGLASIVGIRAPMPLPPAECLRLSGTLTFTLVAGLFVVEFCLRSVFLANDRFRDPILFARQVRARWPAIAASLRHDE